MKKDQSARCWQQKSAWKRVIARWLLQARAEGDGDKSNLQYSTAFTSPRNICRTSSNESTGRSSPSRHRISPPSAYSRTAFTAR